MTFEPIPVEDEEPQLNITPMVDLVFNLLAFFVLTTSYIVERNLAVGSQPPTHRAVAVAAGDLPQFIVVRLTARPGGGAVGMSVGQSTLPDDGFAALTTKLTEINLPETPVLIAAEPDVAIDGVAKVMSAALASPMKRLAFSELASKRPQR